MAGTNQFVPFGTGAGANVLTAQSWAGLAARQSGFVDGIADTAQCNTAWRQPSVLAAMIGQFIADAGYDALDNGDLAALETNFRAAVLAAASGAIPGTALVHYGRDTSTVANSLTVPTVTPAISALTEGMLFVIVPNTTNTGGSVISIGGQASVTLSRKSATSLVNGDVVRNVPFFGMYLGGQVLVLGSVPSEIAITATTVINGLKIPGGTPFPFPNAGTFTLSIAAGVTFSAAGIAAGGGGGGASGLTAAGSGAGQGGKFSKVGTALTDTVLQIVVGAPGLGGTGGSSPTDGASGGSTSISISSGSVQGVDGTTYTAGQTFCAATGGSYGYAGNGTPQNTNAGLGGVSSGGDYNDVGDGGNYPIGPINSAYLGGRGGGCTSDNFGAAGNTSLAPGTGGNGSSNAAPGGTGRAGRVIITK